MKIIIKCTDGIMTGKEWRFNGSGQITLGREKGSMVTTAPEDNSISRHQCVIDVVPPNVYVSDAGSTHGTYVNGQLIGKKGQGGQCPVRDGAFIGVGSGGRTAVFQIRIIEEERGTVSPDYIPDNMDNHYNRSSNGQNLGNDFASSFQFVVPRIRDIFIRPVHTAIEFGKMNSAILGTTMILINMAVLLVLAVIVMAIAKDKLFGFGDYVPWGRIIIGVELMAAFSYFGLAALMLLSARVFFRAEITYAQLLSFYGVQAIWSTAYLLVESFLLMIGTEGSNVLCLFVFWISILHTFLIGIFSYGEVVHLSPDKKMYSYFVFVILYIITYAIILAILGGGVRDSLMDLFNYSSYW